MREEYRLLEWEMLLEQQANPFRELVANFYSLKTGRVALGDWLECSRVGDSVGILPSVGSGSWPV